MKGTSAMRVALIIAVALLLVPVHQAGAGVYKCQGADGKISYQQQACPERDKQSRLDSSKDEWILIGTEQVRDTTPDGRELAWFEKTYMNGSIERIGHLKRAAFRTFSFEDAKDRPTPDLARFARTSYYYYDCASQRIAGGIPGGSIGGYDFQSNYESEDIVHDRLLGPEAEKYFFEPSEYGESAGHAIALRRVCGDH